MVDLQTISLIVQIIGVSATATAAVVGVSNYINSNKRAEEAKKKEQATQELALKAQQQNLETRQAQLLMQIRDQINNRDFLRDYSETMWYWRFNSYDDYFKKYGSKPEESIKPTHILETFNGIAVILYHELVNPRMIYELLGRGVLHYWEKFGPVQKEIDRRSGDSKSSAKVQLLYDEMSRLYEVEVGRRFDPKVRSADDAMVNALDG